MPLKRRNFELNSLNDDLLVFLWSYLSIKTLITSIFRLNEQYEQFWNGAGGNNKFLIFGKDMVQ